MILTKNSKTKKNKFKFLDLRCEDNEELIMEMWNLMELMMKM